jgi:preprotein translocase subunit SecA
MGLEIVGEIFGKVARAIFGSRNERLVRAYQETVEKINALEPQFQRLTDEALRAKTDELRSRLPCDEIAKACRTFSKRIAAATDQQEQKRLRTELRGLINGYLDPLLPEAFAAAREAAKQTVWLGHAEAPADYHPEIQERIRQAMRGEASLLDPETGAPVELFGLYGMRPYDVQLIGAMVLHEGKIAEMATGEGKTLVASLAAYLNALAGRPVHIVSTNDYLVRVGREWNEPIFRRLGLSVGAIQAGMDSHERKPQYACDITYGTNNEFGFDYLRDNMKTSRAEQVQGELAYAIVDECDSVLVDEARTPLIISGPAFESTDKYAKADQIARQLRAGKLGTADSPEGGDFEIKEKEHQCPLTEQGRRRAEQLAGVGSFYVAGNMDWPHLLDQALRAHHLYRLDKEYVVHGEDVIIVDEFTGRLMPGRQWSEGLHQAVEAKEGIRIKEETQTLATITLQNFFRMYDKLAGMTGTAMTEAEEFHKIYDLDVVQVPTNRPLSRVGHADLVFRTEKEKFEAIVEEIKEYHERGRPVLVGTTSIEKNELLSRMLERTHGIPHEVLNAKHHEKEAEIVAVAGQQHAEHDGKPKGNVTVATNMAGRGTDIKLGLGVVFPACYGPWDTAKQSIPSDFGFKCCVGCPEYDPATNCAHCFKPAVDSSFPQRGRTECRERPPCGLHVIGTERHEARRIDNQLRGRSGRQGDPGSSRFFLSLEDDLMRIFARDWVSAALGKLGMEEGMALEHRWLTRGIENAQKKVEERNFGIRKHLLEYDEVMDRQRKIFYGRRQNVLESDDLRDFVWNLLAQSAQAACDQYLSETYSYETIAEWARRNLGVQVDLEALRGKDAEELADYLRGEARQWARETIEETLGEFIPDANETFDDGEPPPKPDYASLVAWAQAHLGVRLRESDLKNASKKEIEERLERAADKRLEATDLSRIQEFLRNDFREAALAEWGNKKFDMNLKASDFAGKDPGAAVETLLERLGTLYEAKERAYPIEFTIEEYLTPQIGQGNQDFEGLARWASRFYLTGVAAEDLRDRDPRKVRDRLLAVAREFESSERLRRTVEEGVRRHLPAPDLDAEEHWQALAQWANQRLGLEMTPGEFVEAWLDASTAGGGTPEAGEPLAREEVMIALVLGRARSDRRARMTELERYLLLQAHDTSWKDHLYEMDRLRSNVGLRGYAQQDPVIEYKREGLEHFEQMLDSTRDKFTDLIFRARWVRQEALARIWAGQSSEHAVAASAYEAQQRAALEAHQQGRMAEEGEAVKQIVREAPKVGRNDPCPCGSGKKYKKCCGRRG